ncbi:hypothetical protein [Phyllobacterium sp. OV277]|uniref:hypothetical protein n=1 Tax=Phyllobacterium sp. OV277 TaxID=1882772 RepID=UPI000888F110|nr:hypothetical protein [Phyllobacterium sp. OV277]SDP08653.1 hypothetical protein SAMN05443582_103364 [Phyllobacterium sp. OV277]
MSGEPTNLPTGGSDNAPPSDALDTALDAMFDEGETEQSNPDNSDKAPATDGTETDDAFEENGEETGDEGETEGDGGEPDPDEATLVTLADGTEISLKELKGGYLRQGDYQKKTQEVSNMRRDAEAKVAAIGQQEAAFSQQHTQLQTTLDGLVDYLASRLPEEPSTTLAMTNPGEYTRQRAMYEAAVGELQTILATKKQVNEQGQQVAYQQHQERLKAENDALIAAFPQIADPAKREVFNKGILDTATKVGFSVDELNTVADHRFLKLGYYAQIGLKALEQQKIGKKKVDSAPALASGKPRPTVNTSSKALQNFKKTGSAQDASKALDAFDWS